MSVPHSEYRVGSSRAYTVFTLALHAGAALMPFMSRVDGAGLALLLAAACWSVVRDLRRVAWRTAADAVVGVRVRSGEWWLRGRDGTLVGPARVCRVRLPGGALVVTLEDARGVSRRLVVPADAMDPQSLRRLRAQALRDGRALAGGAPA